MCWWLKPVLSISHTMPVTLTAHPDFLQEDAIPMGLETYAAEDVAIFAGGHKAYLFQGLQEQSYIYQVMAKALRFKPGQ